MNALTVEGLKHSYKLKNGEARLVLNGLNVSVSKGEIFGLLGPNGGGKTTLFKILSTAFKPDAGSVFLFDVNVLTNPAAAREKMGVVFQYPSLDKKLTLLENLQHQGRLYGLSGATLQERIADSLRRFSLSDRANDLTEQLSGGLKRRGEIAKSLLHNPEILIMDEPSTGLDPAARREMWDTLFELKAQGMTILLTTHLMEEGDKCDQVAILHQGHCVAQGTPNDLKRTIGGDMVTVQTDDAEALREKVDAKFSTHAKVLDGQLRLEIQEGHKFIPLLVEAFPGAIKAVSTGKPTLEDVFVHETGQKFQ
jgi:ABC-2 type transport system ATP-binding protein